MGDEQTASNRALLRALELVAVFPAVVALAVGVTYVVGAALRTARLSAAGVAVTDALPLIPLEQLLAEGIQPALQALLTALGVLLLLSVAFATTFARIEKVRALWLPPRTGRTRRRRIRDQPVVIVCVVLLVAASVVLPPAMCVAMLAVTFGSLYGIPRLRRRDRHPPGFRFMAGSALAITVLLIGATVADSIIDPEPLAQVRVEPRNGSAFTGKFIAIASGLVYAEVGDGPMRAVPLAQTRSVQINPPTAAKPRGVGEYLLGQDPRDSVREFLRDLAQRIL